MHIPPVDPAAAGGWAWENFDRILERAGKVRQWLARRGPAPTPAGTGQDPSSPPAADPVDARPILVIGPGGAGKTTLGHLPSGHFAFFAHSPGGYRESLDLETYGLKDEQGVEVVVAPGQEHRRKPTWESLAREVEAGGF